MHLPPVTIVIRSKNDAALIGDCIDGICSQDYPASIQRIHIDSGSTDGTVEIIKRSKPEQLLQIRAEDYIPGRVLNTGIKLSDTEWIVFLNSDATPVGNQWLAHLIKAAVAKPHTGAAFGRQIPRPDCLPVFVHDYERCFGKNRASRDWPHFFSMVSSAVNRAAWQEHPFREDMRYSEDEEWSFRIHKNGWHIAFAEESVAMHSHNYTLEEVRKRNYGEGFALAATPELHLKRTGLLRGVLLPCGKDAFRDFAYFLKKNQIGAWPRALAVRMIQRLGKRRGFLDGVHQPSTSD